MTAWAAEHVAQIRAQLERVVAGRVFANAGRMPGLLRHLLDSELSGAARRLNQSSIAIDVFDRDENFDPGVDSIVRVEMGRLRNKLREYYTSEGAGDPVVFTVPKGRYSIAVEMRAGTVGAARSATPKQELRFCETKDETVIAYDATTVLAGGRLKQLFHSAAKPANNMGNFAKYSTPIVANGRVYVGTFSNKVVQYGL